MVILNKIEEIYKLLLKEYGHQGWWPLVNNKTLICEYNGGPTTDAERFEVCIGCILAQNTQWYPNVVRAIQQLKLGRPFTKEELEVIEQAEIHKGIIREKPKKQTTDKILTQNTSWKNVEKAVYNLNKENVLDINSIIKMDNNRLASLIRPSGYYNQKAIKLKVMAGFLKKNPIKRLKRIETKKLRELFLSIKGVGPETADSILLYAFNRPVFVVDAYTKRIFSRFGFIKNNATYNEIQDFFHKNLKSDEKIFNEFHALIVEHAKQHCKKTPVCKDCILKERCKYLIK